MDNSFYLVQKNIDSLPYIKLLLEQSNLTKEDIGIVSNDFDTNDFWNPKLKYLQFKPPHRWPQLSLHNNKPGKSFLPL